MCAAEQYNASAHGLTDMSAIVCEIGAGGGASSSAVGAVSAAVLSGPAISVHLELLLPAGSSRLLVPFSLGAKAAGRRRLSVRIRSEAPISARQLLDTGAADSAGAPAMQHPPAAQLSAVAAAGVHALLARPPPVGASGVAPVTWRAAALPGLSGGRVITVQGGGMLPLPMLPSTALQCFRFVGVTASSSCLWQEGSRWWRSKTVRARPRSGFGPRPR